MKCLAALVLVCGLNPSVGLAQSLLASATAETLAPQSSSPSTTWQKDYDTAQSRKNLAKLKMYIGLGAVGGGFLIALSGTESSGPDTGRIMTGMMIDAGGGIVFLWGLVGFFDANGDMNRLNTQRPSGSTSALIPFSDHQGIRVALGTRSTAAYTVGW
jgi:hypothetical protein